MSRTEEDLRLRPLRGLPEAGGSKAAGNCRLTKGLVKFLYCYESGLLFFFIYIGKFFFIRKFGLVGPFRAFKMRKELE